MKLSRSTHRLAPAALGCLLGFLPALGTAEEPPPGATARPAVSGIPRGDPNSALAHEQLLEKAGQGRIDIYFAGDSITRRWGATDYPALLENWRDNFHGWNAANFGWGGDGVRNILWRMEHGELEGVTPKVFVIQGGTNDLPSRGPVPDETVESIVSGHRAILGLCRASAPDAEILLVGLFPRSDRPVLAPGIVRINEALAELSEEEGLRFLNLSEAFADEDGLLRPDLSDDGLHLNLKSYQLWADALKPHFSEILGPPAEEDLAPPPTGDPSAR